MVLEQQDLKTMMHNTYCILYYSFLRISRVRFFKQIQVPAVGQQILKLDHLSFKKIAPAEHPAGQNVIHPLNRRGARDDMLTLILHVNIKARSARLDRVTLTAQ